MKNKLIIAISLVSGIILSLILGFIPYPTGNIIGSRKWGYPIYWLGQAIYPNAPIEILWLNLILNCLIWLILFFLLIKLVDSLLSKDKN